jgi:hypothetical protein
MPLSDFPDPPAYQAAFLTVRETVPKPTVPAPNIISDDQYNPYFFQWGRQKNKIGFCKSNFLNKINVKSNKIPAAGQILPLPQIKALNNERIVDRWAGMGAILSGAGCALALFLAVSSAAPQNWNMPENARQYAQASAAQAIAEANNNSEYQYLEKEKIASNDFFVPDSSSPVQDLLEQFVGWVSRFINL